MLKQSLNQAATQEASPTQSNQYLHSFRLVRPNAFLASGIKSPDPIHPPVPEPQARGHNSDEEAARRAHEIPGGISLVGLVGLPYPLGDNLADAGARVVKSNGKRNSQQTRRVTRHPVRHGRGARECARRREAQTAVALYVGVGGQQAGRQPPNAAGDRETRDVPAARIEVVRGIGEHDSHDEAHDPWRHRHQLRLYGLVAET